MRGSPGEGIHLILASGGTTVLLQMAELPSVSRTSSTCRG